MTQTNGFVFRKWGWLKLQSTSLINLTCESQYNNYIFMDNSVQSLDRHRHRCQSLSASASWSLQSSWLGSAGLAAFSPSVGLCSELKHITVPFMCCTKGRGFQAFRRSRERERDRDLWQRYCVMRQVNWSLVCWFSPPINTVTRWSSGHSSDSVKLSQRCYSVASRLGGSWKSFPPHQKGLFSSKWLFGTWDLGFGTSI